VSSQRRPARAPALRILTAALAVLAAPAARAQTPAASAVPAKAEVPPAKAEVPPAKAEAPPAKTEAPPAIAVPGTTSLPPADAETALQRARAAYEYGEMDMVVDSARLVAEGRLHPTPAQRAQALRYLGIGLYLTDRHEGAETAFFDLLRLKPRTRLDPTTTRPDVVAFFEDVRRRHAVEINEAASNRPGKSLALALLPPLGQFQSGHKARGITIAALEVLSLGGAIATYAQLSAWDSKYAGHTFKPAEGMVGEDYSDEARTLKALNYVSVAVLVTTIVVGIIDGVASYTADEPEDAATSTSVADVFLGGYRF
jgi:hypothetical protein